MFTVYVLRNPAGRLYIGHTSDLERRLEQHQTAVAGWTKSHGPWELVYEEAYPTRGAALRRERALKSGRQNQELRALLRGRDSPA